MTSIRRNTLCVPCLVILLLQTALIHGQKNSPQGGKTGGKNKGVTSSPSSSLSPVAPSISPTVETLSPTGAPTGAPTGGPTGGPTVKPTRNRSTFAPVLPPSEAPSPNPSTPPTEIPTDAPSSSPSSGPSVVPPIVRSTKRPSIPKGATSQPSSYVEPTVKPQPAETTTTEQLTNATTAASVTAVALPLLGISFEVHNQQSDLSASRLQQIFSSWLSGYLVTNPEFGPLLDHVDLQVVEILQNPVRRELQQLGGKSLIQVNVIFRGSAYFNQPSAANTKVAIPTPAELVTTLNNFFSEQSGVQALQDVLSSIVALDVSRGVQVYLNGALITAPPPPAQTAALSSTTQTSPSTGKNSSVGLYFGLGIGVVALTMALLLVFWIRRRRASKTAARGKKRFYLARRREASKRLAAAAATLQHARIGASPREKGEVVGDGSDCSVQSAVSFDSSMYTNNVDVAYRASVPQSPGSYDAKRLERVIRSAKEIVKELSDDESSLYLRSI